MIAGLIIGAGIFATAGESYLNTGSVGASLTTWIVSGIFVLMGGLCYVELGCSMPSNGGEHHYLLKAFGPYVAYTFDWSNCLLVFPSASAGMAIVCAKYILGIYYIRNIEDFKRGDAPQEWLVRLIACLMIIFITTLNGISAKLATKISDCFTIIKVISLTIIISIGIYYLGKGNVTNFKNSFEGYE